NREHAEHRRIEIVGTWPNDGVAAVVPKRTQGRKDESRRVEVLPDHGVLVTTRIEIGVANQIRPLRPCSRQRPVCSAGDGKWTPGRSGKDSVELPSCQEPFPGRALRKR